MTNNNNNTKLPFNKDLREVLTDIAIKRDDSTVEIAIAFGDFSGITFTRSKDELTFNSVTVTRGQSGNHASKWADDFFEFFQSDSETAVKRVNVLVSNYINPNKPF